MPWDFGNTSMSVPCCSCGWMRRAQRPLSEAAQAAFVLSLFVLSKALWSCLWAEQRIEHSYEKSCVQLKCCCAAIPAVLRAVPAAAYSVPILHSWQVRTVNCPNSEKEKSMNKLFFSSQKPLRKSKFLKGSAFSELQSPSRSMAELTVKLHVDNPRKLMNFWVSELKKS